LVIVQGIAINTHETMDSQHASTMNHRPKVICHSSEEGRFITWTQAGHQKQFMEISYIRIKLSTADINVV
jgi:hypothetical protein